MIGISIAKRAIASAAAVAFVFGLAGTGGAARAQAPQMQQLPQIPLNRTIVEAFISSYPTVKQTADSISKKYKIRTEGAEASGWGAWMTANAAWGEMNAVVKPFGFDTFQTWLNATISVATAYAFAKDGGKMDTQMADAMAKMQNDPNIPAAQKQMILQQMQASSGAMASIRPPQANIDAVKPYMTQLGPLFK